MNLLEDVRVGYAHMILGHRQQDVVFPVSATALWLLFGWSCFRQLLLS